MSQQNSNPPQPEAGERGAFPATRWSLVLQAGAGDGKAALAALGELLRTYWQPLYLFARKTGLNHEDAADAVQGFCESLVRQETLHTADPQRGRLRSFLLTGFQNSLRTRHRRDTRLKRGGGQFLLPMDDPDAVELHLMAGGDSPAEAYDRQWARSLLEITRNRLRAEFAARGREMAFLALAPYLAWNEAEVGLKETAAELGITAQAAAQTVQRMRGRFRTLLDEAITETVDGPEALEQERTHLIAALAAAE